MDGGVLADRFLNENDLSFTAWVVFAKGAVMEETLAVNVLGHHLCPFRRAIVGVGNSGTSSKRVICQNQLIQLESLILAQSERWRQA